MAQQNSGLRLLYEQADLPIFQNRCYDTVAEAQSCRKGDVFLVEDLGSGLVYNAAFDSDLVKYDTHYQNEQALSPVFRAHLDTVSALLQRFMGREKLVEIGCGKGFFVEKLLSEGVDVRGFDPTYEGKNPRIRREYFGPNLEIQVEGFILRHVLEHIPDPFNFLSNVATANGHRGLIYIEVPCFEWICQHRAWFDIFYEHVNYFRLSDFHRMFERVLYGERVFGGQYLSVVADLATLRRPVRDANNAVSFPSDFADTCDESAGPPEATSIVWGGASKGVIFALLRARAGYPVGRVIDINPAKQGRYLPVTGLRVFSPSEGLADVSKGAKIYVMNPNYLDEVQQMTNHKFTYIGVGE